MRFRGFLFALLISGSSAYGQELSISVESGVSWFTPDFYLNYRAVENDDLVVTYADGAVDNRVEHYDFSPLVQTVLKIGYEVRNPRNRKKGTIYHAGIGYANASFLVEYPSVVFSNELGYVIMAGVPRDYRYVFDYVVIPLGISGKVSKPGSAWFGSYGVEITNYLLVNKGGQVKYEGESSFQEYYDGRLASARDYLLMLHIKPAIGVNLGRRKDWSISVSPIAGVSFMNVLRKEKALFKDYNFSEQTGVEQYEEARSLNFCYGGMLSFALSLD